MTTILLCVSLTRNPLYLVVVWLCVAIVHAAGGMGELAGGNTPFPFWLSLLVILVGAVFNALTVHVGERIIFVLPGNLPFLSGRVTWEAVVYGATNGIALSVILLAFWVFNRNVAISSFLRMLPRAFHSVAIVASIAITFVPLLQRELEQIQEAQVIRGNDLSGFRNKLALLLPLLISSLEHAFQLAEVMTARGFLKSSELTHAAIWRGAFLGGFGLMLGGWLSRFWGLPGWAANLLFVAALAIFGIVFLVESRQVHFTVYRSTRFRLRDALAMSGPVLLAVFFVFHRFVFGEQLLDYTPYPVLTRPPFKPLVACLLLGILNPFLVTLFQSHDSVS
jgi:energy-coupling factor transporter transmembrane protein EcfT